MASIAAALGQDDSSEYIALNQAHRPSSRNQRNPATRGVNSVDTATTLSPDVFFDIDDEDVMMNQRASDRNTLLNNSQISPGSLPGNQLKAKEKKGKRCVRCVLWCSILILILAGLIYYFRVALLEEIEELSREASKRNRKNVIFMLADGFGPASESLARTYYSTAFPQSPYFKMSVENDPVRLKDEYQQFTLPLDKLMRGAIRTKSSSSFVTDSAAGATAYSCGKKTYNGAIGVVPKDGSFESCQTVMEAAYDKGFRTGIVVTSRVTHATPAAFSAHVGMRSDEADIAAQQLFGYNGTAKKRKLDLLMGGGRCFFVPSDGQIFNNDDNMTEIAHQRINSCRSDKRNLIQEALSSDWKVMQTRSEFDQLSPDSFSFPILGVFTDDHMSYEIDRNPAKEPSLAEMTEKALQLFSKQPSDKGFFLMVEGSRIDMAGHSNDPAAHLQDIFAYQDAVQVAQRYAETHRNTIVISVADHETGGLTVGRQNGAEYPEYRWLPLRLKSVRNSTEVTAPKLVSELIAIDLSMQDAAKDQQKKAKIIQILETNLGLTNVRDVDVDYILLLAKRAVQDGGIGGSIDLSLYSPSILPIQYFLSDLESRNAEVGWTTHGHTGVDINLYVYGLDPMPAGIEKKQQFSPLLNNSFLGKTTNDPVTISWASDGFQSRYQFLEDLPTFESKKAFEGNNENTDVGHWMADILGVKLMDMIESHVQTAKLRKRWLRQQDKR